MSNFSGFTLFLLLLAYKSLSAHVIPLVSSDQVSQLSLEEVMCSGFVRSYNFYV